MQRGSEEGADKSQGQRDGGHPGEEETGAADKSSKDGG